MTGRSVTHRFQTGATTKAREQRAQAAIRRAARARAARTMRRIASLLEE